MKSIIEQLNEIFIPALTEVVGEEKDYPTPVIVPATNPKFGDFQCNLALPLAKTLGQQPRAIAEQIIAAIKPEEIYNICEPLTIAGPGFINLTLKSDYISSQIKQMRQNSRLGVEKIPQPERVIVDFSSPNIAKEMHVGHLRSTIIGDSIARVLEFRGYDVLRLNHVGDWGTQFGMLITYLKEVYPDALTQADVLDLGDLVTFYKQAKIRFDADEQFKEASRQAVVTLQAGDPLSLKAWQLLCEQSRREFQVIYELLDIALMERGESFYNPLLATIVSELETLGLLTEDQGAKCVFLDGFTNKEGNPLPLIIQKSDGGYNYATTDLAALKYRIQSDQATKIIYVTDASQGNHFAQVFQVARKAGILPESIAVVHVPFGLVKGEDGKKLKTRSGETIRLKDLLTEAVNHARQDLEKRLQAEGRQETPEFMANVAQVVGIAAVKYADLSQNRSSDYGFSYEKMLALQGNTAPYMLYAYARIKSISREGQINLQALGEDAPVLLQEVSELALAKALLQLTEVIKEVETSLLPHRLCDYLYELSKKFNQFYESCPVLKAEEPIKTSRLILCDLTARTLALGLSLLGIPLLERM
ncbi:MAG: arginine--tRNA ligase [Snowella sp.]|nr:arginine--tRNA ligase [Snowella sp.]